MNREDLRKAQLAQLEIALEIKRVCDANGIEYFLEAGTLLGAVRHKGFIPWDDDMDLSMTRNNYERFLEVAPQQLSEQYHLETWDSDAYIPFPFAKVKKRGTRFVEAYANKNANNELWVDVFPRDNFPDSLADQKKMKKKTRFLRHLMVAKCKMKPWMRERTSGKKILTFVMYAPFFVMSVFCRKEGIKQKWLEELTRFNTQSCERRSIATMEDIDKCVIPANCLDSFVEIEFEEQLFRVPENHHVFLTAMYGDYMQLPPENERENRHRIIELKL